MPWDLGFRKWRGRAGMVGVGDFKDCRVQESCGPRLELSDISSMNVEGNQRMTFVKDESKPLAGNEVRLARTAVGKLLYIERPDAQAVIQFLVGKASWGANCWVAVKELKLSNHNGHI